MTEMSIESLRNNAGAQDPNTITDPNVSNNKVYEGGFVAANPENTTISSEDSQTTTMLDTALDQDFKNYIERQKAEAIDYIANHQLDEELNEDDGSGLFDSDNSFDTDSSIENNIDTATEISEHRPVVSIDSAAKSNNSIPEYNQLSYVEDAELEAELADDKNSDDDISESQMEVLKASIREKIKPVSEKFDITTFTITKEAVSLSTTLRHDETSKRVTDWVLMSGNKPVSMLEFSGAEVEALNQDSSGRSRLNAVRDTYQRIYNHIVNPNKPEFEQWLRTTSFLDIEHLFFATYKSCFDGANYIPYSCSERKCNHVFLSENIPIMDMVKFKDDAAKNKFLKIASMDNTYSKKALYVTEIIPVSDNYAIAFREPSIYNLVMENAVLDRQFTETHANLLSIIVYIDNIYYIDRNNRCLSPINIKTYPNDMTKTVKAKILQYQKVIQTLSCDQYNALTTYIKSINDLGTEISYILPSATCPKCGAAIKESEKRAQELVFTRHQLAALASI